ncbi:MAG: TonB-dependent receptor [Gammaproteobacteria bacterium]|nr:TonB-dependent receptor [Gammaproteobacteria bacterium]
MRTLSLRAGALCLALLPGVTPLLVTPAAAQSATAEPMTFNLRAQPLDQAVTELARQAGLTIGGDAALLRSRQAPALQGRYTPHEALRILLTGSGVAARFAGDSTVTLMQASAQGGDGPVQLAPIQVTGTGGSAFAPVEGYQATHSYTATRTDTPIIDTPASVQVVPNDVLEDQQVLRLKDAIKNVSGVQPRGASGVSSEQLTIRGFDQGGFIFRDGFRTPNTFGARFFELSNVDRVEVLKGPASVLFGRIEPGGVVNLVTKKPLREYQHSIEQQVGSYDFYRTTVDTTGPIPGLESVQYRLIASYVDADSFRDVVENETVFINPQLAWDITDRTRVNFSFEYRDDDRTNDSGLPALGDEVADVPEDTFLGSRDDFLKTEMLRVALDGSHAFNDSWLFRTKFVYEDFERRDARLDGAFGSSIDPTTGDFDRRFSANNAFPETWFTTNSLEGHFDTGALRHTLLLGVDFTRSDLPWTFPDNAFSPGPGNNLFNPNPNPTVTPSNTTVDFGSSDDFDKRLGVFWQDQISFFDDRLHLLVGGRYDDTEARSFGTKNENEEYSQRYGVLFKPKRWLSLYGSYAQSLSGNVIFARTRSGEPLDPEEGEQWEVGAKALFFDERLSATLTWFDLTKENIAAPDPDGGDFSVAIGEAESRGLELDVAGEIAPGWKLIASYGWLPTVEITEDSNLGQEGNRLFNAPRHAGSLWSTYTLQGGELRGLTLGAGIFGVSEREGDNANSFEADGYARVDAMARYPFILGSTRVTAQLNIENLFDIDYIESTGNSRIAGNHPGAPLSALFSLKAEF